MREAADVADPEVVRITPEVEGVNWREPAQQGLVNLKTRYDK